MKLQFGPIGKMVSISSWNMTIKVKHQDNLLVHITDLNPNSYNKNNIVKFDLSGYKIKFITNV